MLDFKKFFNNEYEFTLKKAMYDWIEVDHSTNDLRIKVDDHIKWDIIGDRLEVTFSRDVGFIPKSLYTIGVVFCFGLTFRDDTVAVEAKEIDWGKEFVEQANPYLENIISRASFLIASITSSYGQKPLITPPSFIKQ